MHLDPGTNKGDPRTDTESGGLGKVFAALCKLKGCSTEAAGMPMIVLCSMGTGHG